MQKLQRRTYITDKATVSPFKLIWYEAWIFQIAAPQLLPATTSKKTISIYKSVQTLRN